MFNQPPLILNLRGRKLIGRVAFAFLLLSSITFGTAAGLLFVYASDLPEIRALEDYRPDVVTELYADDGQLVGSFALQRRILITYDQVPQVLKDAILVTEDQHFEEHWGIDFPRVAQAAWRNIVHRRKAEGASTLTMQLARVLFLSPDKSFRRKVQETLLAIQIERRYTKQQIFTMYCNQIYLAHGNYGFEAASQFYFGKPASQLKLAEAALLRALIRGPIYSPVVHHHAAPALRDARGKLDTYEDDDWRRLIENGSYVTGLVTAVDDKTATVKIGPYRAVLTAPDFAWTGRRSPAQLLKVGDLAECHIKEITGDTARVELDQKPAAQAALVAIENTTGEIKAMVGGYSFEESKFNRATQALRQVGSSFKPYVYTAAIEKGMTPFDTVLDAPFTTISGGQAYSPHNYDEKFEGVITLRRALAGSRNIPAVKVAEKVGISNVVETTRRFGITSSLPPYLPVALGAAAIRLLAHTSAFTVFPNDGIRIESLYIRPVTSYDGALLAEARPVVHDVNAPPVARTLDPRRE